MSTVEHENAPPNGLPTDVAATMDAGLGHHRSRSTVTELSIREPKFIARGLSRKDLVVGIGLTLVTVVLWTLASFTVQGLYEGGYHKPFMMTYVTTSAFSVYLIPYCIRRAFGRQSSYAPWRWWREDYELLMASPEPDEDNSLSVSGVHAHSDGSLPPLTIRETARVAFEVSIFWFMTNWTSNVSLDYTTVASSVILGSTTMIFTLIIGRIFNVEAVTVAKVLSVLASIGGVVLVALSDSKELATTSNAAGATNPSPHGSNLLLGDSLALLSAVLYALYLIFLKARIRSEDRIDIQLLFGFMGLFCSFLWPLGIILHLTGFEELEFPSTRGETGAIVINMAILVTSDYCYMLAMLKTTPLIVTVGLSLTIPFAVFGDFILGRPIGLQGTAGALLVVIGFFIVGSENWRNGEGQVSDEIPIVEDQGDQLPTEDGTERSLLRRYPSNNSYRGYQE